MDWTPIVAQVQVLLGLVIAAIIAVIGEYVR